MDKTYEAPQGRLLSTVVVFLFVLGVLYTLFLVFQQFQLNHSIRKIGEQSFTLESEMKALEDNSVEALFTAQDLVDRVKEKRIVWSQVVKQLQDITPVTVFFSSYGASEEGSIQLSGLGDNYGAVADLIAKMDKSPHFGEAFVPSLTLGTTGEGQSVVSFSLQVQTLSQ